MGNSRVIVNRRYWLEMEKQERERRGASATSPPRIQLTVEDRGWKTKLNQPFELLYHLNQLLSSIYHTSCRPQRAIILLVQMAPKPISTLALPRSTLLALSQAGYETTDELASASPESLAKGKSASPEHRGRGCTFLMGVISCPEFDKTQN